MEIIDNKEVPQLTNDSERDLENLMKKLEESKKIIKSIQKTDLEDKWKSFWNYCENPIPVVYRDLKYKNRFIISRSINLEGGEKTVKDTKKGFVGFIDSEEVPKANRGSAGIDWLALLQTIPKGKSGIFGKEGYGASTVRKAIMELEESGQIKKGEYLSVQRTDKDDVTKVYVSHVEPEAESETKQEGKKAGKKQ